MMPNLSQAVAESPAQGGEGEAAQPPRKPAQRRPRKPKATAEDGEAAAPVAPNE
jgi:hypothetical protein